VAVNRLLAVASMDPRLLANPVIVLDSY
jgi:hypothetical protein